jgi:hypothetical protein
MRWKYAALVLTCAAVGAVGKAPAQSLNSDMGLGGGTGIGRHAGGFDGTYGDPEIFPGPRDRAWPVSGYVPSTGLPSSANAPTYLPGAPGYGVPPGNRPIEFYFPPPPIR